MLQNLQRRLDKRDEGFTLIELLMVIVILAILAAVVVFSVTGITDTGKKSACKATLNTINTAAEANYAAKGTGAATLGALVTNGFLKAQAASGTGVALDATTGTSWAEGDYTITFTPGAPGAGDASSTDAVCA
jgi:prepilin-type N-terminal cleavage/methylation domain-containing protein